MSETISAAKPHPTISMHVWNASHSWWFEHTYRFAGMKLRTTIRRNAYDAQSYAKVDRWNGEEWKNVLRRDLCELGYEVQALTYVHRDVTDAPFLATALELEAEAEAIVS